MSVLHTFVHEAQIELNIISKTVHNTIATRSKAHVGLYHYKHWNRGCSFPSRGMKEGLRLFLPVVLSFTGRDLTMDQSPVQEVLTNV
jgi:hypothetical protein